MDHHPQPISLVISSMTLQLFSSYCHHPKIYQSLLWILAYILIHFFHHIHQRSLRIFIFVFLIILILSKQFFFFLFYETRPFSFIFFWKINCDTVWRAFVFALAGIYFFEKVYLKKSKVFLFKTNNSKIKRFISEITRDLSFFQLPNSLKIKNINSMIKI